MGPPSETAKPEGYSASEPAPVQVALARFQHLRQRAGLPPFQLDPVLCASALLAVLPKGPGRVQFGGRLGPLGYDKNVDEKTRLDRVRALEDPRLTLVGVGAVQQRQRVLVRVLLACSRRSPASLAMPASPTELPSLGLVKGPEPARWMLWHLQRQRQAAQLPPLLPDPILCAEATLLAAEAAGVGYEEARAQACVPVERLERRSV